MQIGCKFRERGKVAVISKREANWLSKQRKIQSTSECPIFRLFSLYILHSLSSLFLTPSPNLPLHPYPYLPAKHPLHPPSSSSLLSTLHPSSSSSSSLNILLPLPSFSFLRERGWGKKSREVDSQFTSVFKCTANLPLSPYLQPIRLLLQVYY